jgi:hypothetical protein
MKILRKIKTAKNEKLDWHSGAPNEITCIEAIDIDGDIFYKVIGNKEFANHFKSYSSRGTSFDFGSLVDETYKTVKEIDFGQYLNETDF